MSMQNKVLVMALGLGCLFSLTAKAQTPRLPVYQVGRTSGPIKVDGKLDDTAWKRAPLVGDFVNNSDGSQSTYKIFISRRGLAR